MGQLTGEACLALVGHCDLRVGSQFYEALCLLAIVPGLATVTREHRPRVTACWVGDEPDVSLEVPHL